MKGEFPWIYVAMLVIAFISWVFNRIQEATAARQRSKEQSKPRNSRPDTGPWTETTVPPPLPQQRPSPPQQVPAEKPGEVMRDLLEALGVPPQPEPAPEVVRRQQQPPVSKARRQPVENKRPPASATPLSAAERAALDRIKSQAAPLLGPATVDHRSAGVEVTQVKRLLRSPSGLRQALVLKEILDTPISLRNEGQ